MEKKELLEAILNLQNPGPDGPEKIRDEDIERATQAVINNACMHSCMLYEYESVMPADVQKKAFENARKRFEEWKARSSD